MIKSNTDSSGQAAPLIIGKINIDSGTHIANCFIHCEVAGTITLSDGTSYDFKEDADRGYQGKFTIVSGTYTFD